MLCFLWKKKKCFRLLQLPFFYTWKASFILHLISFFCTLDDKIFNYFSDMDWWLWFGNYPKNNYSKNFSGCLESIKAEILLSSNTINTKQLKKMNGTGHFKYFKIIIILQFISQNWFTIKKSSFIYFFLSRLTFCWTRLLFRSFRCSVRERRISLQRLLCKTEEGG